MQPPENCQLCKRCETRRRAPVNGDGYEGADIMLVVDAPTREDENRGFLLSGRGGDLMRRLLEDARIDEERLYVSSATRCIGLNAPVKKEIEACQPFLLSDIESVRPQVIVTFGTASLTSVMGRTKGVTALRGSVFQMTFPSGFECSVVPTYAPGIVYKDPAKWETIVSDLRKARTAIDGLTEPEGTEVFVAQDIGGLYVVRDTLLGSDEFAFDFETTGLNYLAEATPEHVKADVLCASFSCAVGKALVIPLKGQYVSDIWDPEEYQIVLAVLKEILESDVPKIASNGKFDCLWAWNVLDIEVQNFAFDTQLGYAMVHEERPHNLEHMRTLFTAMAYYEGFKEQADTAELKYWGYAVFPNDELWQYAGADADCEYRIAQVVRPLIEAESAGVETAFTYTRTAA